MENNNDKSETEGSNPEVQFPTNSPQVVNEQGDHSPFTNQVVDNGAVDNSLEERNTDSLNDSIDSERSGENAYSRNRQRRPRITLHFNDDMATDRTENAIEEIEQPSSDDDVSSYHSINLYFSDIEVCSDNKATCNLISSLRRIRVLKILYLRISYVS